MAKTRTTFFCQNCGQESSKWLGKCPSCGNWNTFVEELVQKEEPGKNDWKTSSSRERVSKAKTLQEIESSSEIKILTPDNELNRVLGGGIVPGSLVLIGGEPGIGKSTLMLQLALALKELKVLYVSGEESEQQIKMRAERLKGVDSTILNNKNFYTLTETNTKNIFLSIETLDPQLVIVDSIQTLYSNLLDSTAGSIAQVRQCAGELMKFSKETNTPVFLVGHITKDGLLAGPKVLEHMVDTVLQFEGDRHLAYRIVRTIKNRFGTTSELGIYEMRQDGLREVSNPSELLLTQRAQALSGIAIGASLEGNRSLLIETQALVSPATYRNAQRSTTGFDTKRLNMLLAVLEKRGGLRLSSQDIFLNIAGGISVEDPALDLAVCAALASSVQDKALSQQYCFAAEVGLGGETRGVSRIEQRIAEAARLGFQKIFISQYNLKGLVPPKEDIQIVPLSRIEELLHSLLL